uniref:Uncharacterized protein n=1 Tax=Cacopsylla melanoneura TaxID=428564 RepID=A0A8D9E9N9_9HEMI
MGSFLHSMTFPSTQMLRTKSSTWLLKSPGGQMFPENMILYKLFDLVSCSEFVVCVHTTHHSSELSCYIVFPKESSEVPHQLQVTFTNIQIPSPVSISSGH